MNLKKILFIVLWAFSLISFVYARDSFKCTKVFDGDTIEISNGEKVRLIGVDTPELYHPAKPREYYTRKARSFTRKLVEGKTVHLEYDAQKYDGYKRLLAYVYLDDGTFVNAEIIKQGFGFAYTRYPFKYKDNFKEYEKTARNKKLGLWKGKGAYELQWILGQKRKPFEIYEMTNNKWGILYDDFIKPRINDKELVKTLRILRIWINEYSSKELSEKLYKNGWLKQK
jgi:endonuclease YncB( thermonuclease family)